MEPNQQDTEQPEKVIDPVCGMKVDPVSPRGGTHVHDGRTYAFCNPRCREKFAAAPERYLAERPAAHGADHAHAHGAHASLSAAAPAPPGTEWICPMDPEVVQDHPGPC